MTVTTDERYMRKALEEARRAFDADEIPVGAVVVCGDQIIARGHNLTEMLHDVTAHAEMQAITSAADYLGGKYLDECTLYVTVEPCPMCAGAILNARIPRVVYGAADSKAGFCGSVADLFSMNVNHHPQILGGVREAEASALLTDFFQQLRVTLRGRPKWRPTAKE